MKTKIYIICNDIAPITWGDGTLLAYDTKKRATTALRKLWKGCEYRIMLFTIKI